MGEEEREVRKEGICFGHLKEEEEERAKRKRRNVERKRNGNVGGWKHKFAWSPLRAQH